MRMAVLANQFCGVATEASRLAKQRFDAGLVLAGIGVHLSFGKLAQIATSTRMLCASAYVYSLQQIVGKRDHDLRHEASISGIANVAAGWWRSPVGRRQRTVRRSESSRRRCGPSASASPRGP